MYEIYYYQKHNSEPIFIYAKNWESMNETVDSLKCDLNIAEIKTRKITFEEFIKGFENE